MSTERPSPPPSPGGEGDSHLSLLLLLAQAEHAAALDATARVAEVLEELDGALREHVAQEEPLLLHLTAAARELVEHGQAALLDQLVHVRELAVGAVDALALRNEVFAFGQHFRRQARLENVTRWDAASRPAPVDP